MTDLFFEVVANLGRRLTEWAERKRWVFVERHLSDQIEETW